MFSTRQDRAGCHRPGWLPFLGTDGREAAFLLRLATGRLEKEASKKGAGSHLKCQRSPNVTVSLSLSLFLHLAFHLSVLPGIPTIGTVSNMPVSLFMCTWTACWMGDACPNFVVIFFSFFSSTSKQPMAREDCRRLGQPPARNMPGNRVVAFPRRKSQLARRRLYR